MAETCAAVCAGLLRVARLDHLRDVLPVLSLLDLQRDVGRGGGSLFPPGTVQRALGAHVDRGELRHRRVQQLMGEYRLAWRRGLYRIPCCFAKASMNVAPPRPTAPPATTPRHRSQT